MPSSYFGGIVPATTQTDTLNIRTTSVGDRVVLDASVALAFLTQEAGSEAASDAIAGWQASETEMLVPSHFWLEVTNMLGRRAGVGPQEVIAMFVDLDELAPTTVELDRPLLLLALDQMLRFGLTAYDAIYLALALSTGSRLATLDRRLAQAAGDAGVLIGSTGVSESGATYQADRPDYTGWAHTAVVGAHIADLRKKALAEA
jgi:predicted nucleic acid-binding protein